MELYINGRRFSALWRLPVVLFGIVAELVLNTYLIIEFFHLKHCIKV